jgi:hypothetical protein
MIPSAVKQARIIFALVLLLIAICSTSAMIGTYVAYVNTASGGDTISADTSAGAANETYTLLTGPEIVETAPGQIGAGNIIIEIPNGFEIDIGAAVAAIVTNSNDPDDPSQNINGVANGTAIPVLAIDSTHVTFMVTTQSSVPNSLLFVNISVMPAAGTPLIYGNIILSEDSDSEITGIEYGYTLGTLKEVPGAVATLVISPSHATINQSSSRSYSATGRDQFNNPTGILTSSTTFSIDPLANGSFSANVYTAEKAGVWTVTGTHGSVNDTATLTVLDITPPVITTLGSSNMTIEVLTPPYIEENATAIDDTDGDITGAIVTVSTLNQLLLGTYTVTYSVNDSAGNIGVAVRIVNVVDTTAPVITVIGANPAPVSYGDVYTDEGATADDNYDGDITGSIITVNMVNTSVLGVQTVTYDVNDSSGNTAHAERIVNVTDKEVPIITLLGTTPVNVPINTSYVDAGATALDNADGDITANIVTTSNVNTNAIGAYSVTYDVSDSSGNAAMTVTRIVNVVDVTPPVITVLGNSTVTIERTTPYNDSGATAMDDIDGDLTSAIVTINPIDPNTVGTYTVIYNVSDAAKNTAQATRTVIVEDTTPPVITIIGDNPMTIQTGSVFTDPGVSANENGTITTTGEVNSSVAGTYYITYLMTDNSGNEAANVTRTVNVVNPIVTTGGGGGGGGGGGHRTTTQNTPPPAPTGGQEPIILPQLPLVTGSHPPQPTPAPETVNIQPSGETAPAETGELPIIQPQATGIFNLNTRMKWFGIGVLLLLLIALGTYAFRRMRKNSKPQFYP